MALGSLEDGEIAKKALGPEQAWAAKVDNPLPETKWIHVGDKPSVAIPASPTLADMPIRSREPSDAEIAESLRLEIAPYLVQIAAVMNKAQAHGMAIQFNIGIGPSGKNIVGPIGVLKHL